MATRGGGAWRRPARRLLAAKEPWLGKHRAATHNAGASGSAAIGQKARICTAGNPQPRRVAAMATRLGQKRFFSIGTAQPYAVPGVYAVRPHTCSVFSWENLLIQASAAAA